MYSLKEKGETTNDLPMNLSDGYTACSNKLFVKYIAHKHEGYEEGINILPDNRVHLAVQKFNILKTTNEWNAPS